MPRVGTSSSSLVALAPTTSARNVIQPTSATATALALRGASGQTAPLWQLQAPNAATSRIEADAEARKLTFVDPPSDMGSVVRGLEWTTYDHGKWRVLQDDALWNGTRNPYLLTGYNVAPGGQPDDVTEHTYWWGMEPDYNDGSIRHMEWNLDYKAPGRSTKRWMGFDVNRATDVGGWTFWADRTLGFMVANSGVQDIRLRPGATTYLNLNSNSGQYSYIAASDNLGLGVGTSGNNVLDATTGITILKAGSTGLYIQVPAGTTRAILDANGDFALGTAGKGLILKSPDGLTTKKVTIDNAGALALL